MDHINCVDHINNGPYQLLKKDPTTKIKVKTLKQLMVLKGNKFIDNKLHYRRPADLPEPRIYCRPKICKPRVPIRSIVSYSGSLLYNPNKAYIKDENNNIKHSTRAFRIDINHKG